MIINYIKTSLVLFVLVSCINQSKGQDHAINTTIRQPKVTINDSNLSVPKPIFKEKIIIGAAQTQLYLPLLKEKTVALVVNQTSTIGNTHLVDSLLGLGIKVKTIFAPEHGFRGDHSAGAKVNSGVDEKTGLSITSLYGSHKKPTKTDLQGITYVVFDIQDVGARFYTYLSTMHYVMEACAENNIPFMVLDRPNPNGFYIDGPILENSNTSFVGLHPIPIVHGMTLGELALMINGEKWLSNGIQTTLKVIPCANYHHNREYILPIKPSPNLPTQASIYLYPSLCLFEGTNISVGRGTAKPFECFGKPNLAGRNYSFTPRSMPGVADNPPFKNQECKGALLSSFGLNFLPNTKRLYLDWLILCYEDATLKKEPMFNDFFIKLAGTSTLQEQIKNGMNQETIFASWDQGIISFKKQRKPYLLYEYLENIGIIE